jgi:CubicO group peptidase (beta-lactamase class C family)
MNFPNVGVALAALCVSLALGSAEALANDNRFPEANWERLDPAASGWSSEKLAKAEAWSRVIHSSAVMVVHRGAVVAEWGDTAAKTPLASVRNSLLSALIGNAVERGQINLAQPIGALGIDDNDPALTEEEKTAMVGDLLKARSGIYHAALFETQEMSVRRPPGFSNKPGEFWYYNNWDFNALGAIYERAVRMSIFDSFEREIARPIGMQDYRSSDGDHLTGVASIHAAYPIRMSARDLARFALLYLRKGRWQDRQIVPSRWIEESTRAWSNSGFGPGYGYMWWTGFPHGSIKLPEGSFFAAGTGGQFAFVIPAYDLVVVHRAAHNELSSPTLRDMGRLLWFLFDAGGYSDIGPTPYQ